MIPQFKGSDGILREVYRVTTTVANRFFNGVTDSDTVDLQVSVRGGAFTSNPDYVSFEGTTFTIPNPSAFPDGLQLLPGENDVRVRAVLTSGRITQEGQALAVLVPQDTTSAVAPSGFFMERQDHTVRLVIEGLTDDRIIGYNFYGSTSAGGGLEGYTRINPEPMISSTLVADERVLGTMTLDAMVVLNSEGDHADDPMYIRFSGTQEDSTETVLQTDFMELVEIPETTNQLRTEITLKEVRQVRQFSFIHDRASTVNSGNPSIPNSAFNSLALGDPIYYVSTAIYSIDGLEYESPFSPELAGGPLVVTPTVGTFPSVTRQEIVRDTVLSIYRTQPELRVDPGSALRDTFIDPFSTEAERLRFIVDFLHRSQSFSTLLAVDDPQGIGEPIPVSQSPYKQALLRAFFLKKAGDVQILIDNAFDKLASNYGVVRQGGKRARGEVTFFVGSRPSSTIPVPLGQTVLGGGTRFRTTSPATISASGAGTGFNPVTGRYSARAFVQAEDTGASGNLAARQISVVEGGQLGLQVVNESRLFGGQDEESNRDLAVRTMLRLASVDSGTLQGYLENAIQVPGVVEVAVVESGNSLMMRDFNDAGRHVGGKVDVWLRGNSQARVTDTFAFGFDVARDMHFVPAGDLSTLTFRALDKRLTPANPIIELLDIEEFGIAFHNSSKSYDFDITGAVAVAFDTIKLLETYNDPTQLSLGDDIRGSYRYRTSRKLILTRQPVDYVVSVTGTRSGTLSLLDYNLYRASDPLNKGRSTIAGDYVQVVQAKTNSIPSPLPIRVTGEAHVILDGLEYLDSLGINPLTVKVFNADRSIEYLGPFSTETQRDFTMQDEVGDKPVALKTVSGSRILSGQAILVDYSHDENFVVEYESNGVIRVVQDIIDRDSHITADAIVKEAVPVAVDITGTVILSVGQSQRVVDLRVRSALSLLFSRLGLGDPVRKSDVIRAIDAVQGVSYVTVPMVKLAYGDDSLMVREPVLTDTPADRFLITSWSTDTVNTFVLTNALKATTIHGGGATHEFRGVFQDELQMELQNGAPDSNGVPLKLKAGRAFIIGSDGLVIPGYSDTTTLKTAAPFATDSEILVQRKALTAGRTLLTLKSEVPTGDTADDPTKHKYTATYVTNNDSGVKNIVPSPIQYLTLGTVTLDYDEDDNR